MTPDLHRAARLAAKTLLRFEVNALPVDPAALLRRIPGARLMSFRQARDLLPPSQQWALDSYTLLDAALLMGEAGWLILYRRDLPLPQRRYNFAHELGHLACRHGGGLHEPWQEAEADCFARHLLVP